MRPAQTIDELARFERRGAGSDAERRAASWLASRLEAGGREARIELFWCRPNWALAHVWHVALGLAGSLLAVHSPQLGGALILVALLFVVLDELAGISPGRLLSPERASQNVVGAARDEHPVTLILTANYDAGRTGGAYRDLPRRMAAAARRLLGPICPGWAGWLVLVLAWLLAVALLRAGGAHGTAIGVAQLPPTVALVLMLAALLDLGTAGFGPGAGDNGSGVAAVLAIGAALDASPPRHLAVEIVLHGAGDAGGIGLRRHLRAHRRSAPEAVVLGIAPCASGSPRWWVSDGPLVPLRYLDRLRELCAKLARDERDLGAAPHRGRGSTPALQARAARLPAISIGCLDGRGLVPRSHQALDEANRVDAGALDATVQFGLMLVDEIDTFIGHRERARGNRS